MSNYPPGCNDSDPYFTDTNEPDEPEPEEAIGKGWIWPKDEKEAANYEYEFSHGDILSLCN